MIDSSGVRELLEVAREEYPDLYRKIDKVAEIIDPVAFSSGETVILQDSKRDHRTERLCQMKREYNQSEARRKAHQILQALGHEVEDWGVLFAALKKRGGEKGCVG